MEVDVVCTGDVGSGGGGSSVTGAVAAVLRTDLYRKNFCGCVDCSVQSCVRLFIFWFNGDTLECMQLSCFP